MTASSMQQLHTEMCRKLLRSEEFRYLKCVACSSKFKNGETLKVQIERCNSYKYLKMSNSKIEDANKRESVAHERSKQIADNQGSIESEIKLNQEEETTGNSHQLTTLMPPTWNLVPNQMATKKLM